MAAKAAGLSVQKMIRKYLVDKLGLKHTGWLIGQNTLVAAGMHTTPDDYDTILRSYRTPRCAPTTLLRPVSFSRAMPLSHLLAPLAVGVRAAGQSLALLITITTDYYYCCCCCYYCYYYCYY